MGLNESDEQLFRSMVTELVNVTSKMGPMLLLPCGLTDTEWQMLRRARLPDVDKPRGRKMRKSDVAQRLVEVCRRIGSTTSSRRW